MSSALRGGKRARFSVADMEAQLRGAFETEGGFSPEAVEHFRTFVREGDFEIDNRRVDADAFFWLDPFYDLRRSELLGEFDRMGRVVKPRSERFREGLMLRKSSQGGATVFGILFLLWLCIDPRRGLNIGAFFPRENDVIDFVQMRLMPVVRSSEKMRPYLRESAVDNVRTKQIGKSNLWLRHVSGGSMTDGVPMDIFWGDEVRLWGDPKSVSDLMQRIFERCGQSDIGLMIYGSTVGSRGDAMESLWAESNQVKYFTACPTGCRTEIRANADDPEDRLLHGEEHAEPREGALVVDGICLSDWDPHRITRLNIPQAGERATVDWVCPCCGTEITDRRAGPGFVPTFPNAPGMYGLEFARTLYHTVDAARLRGQFDRATDKKQFWNGWMAKPYTDPAGSIVKPDHIAMARLSNLAWRLSAPAGMDTYLGADFRTDEIHVVVLGVTGRERWGDDGEEQVRGHILHVEVMQQGERDYARLEKMVRDYRVRAALIDYRPHTSVVRGMVARNELVIHAASYVQGAMLRRRGEQGGVGQEVREKNMVLLDRTKSLKYSLHSFAQGLWRMPAEPLHQQNFFDRKRNLHPAYDVAWEFTDHLQNIAVTRIDKTAKNAAGEKVRASAEFTERFDDVGFDPHFVHAFNYAVMASQLNAGGMTLHGGSVKAERAALEALEAAEARGGVSPFAALLGGGPTPMSVPTQKRCGACRYALNEGGERRCAMLGFAVKDEDPACPQNLFRPRRV